MDGSASKWTPDAEILGAIVTISQDTRKHIEVIADETLDTFEKVAEAANSKLRQRGADSSRGFPF